MGEKILSIVVTYNRLELLKRCYKALQRQTHKDFDILIVNNGSTDGSKEWIDSLPESVLKIHQENLGGAGGFYAGEKYGYDNGYDWLWLMDDDGVPADDQLEKLLKICTAHNLKFANPLVCNIAATPSQETLCLNNINAEELQKYEYTPLYSCPFNGTFINRVVIDKIGLIRKEMFIWGDEVEYRQRARINGFELMTIPSAIHYHPPMKMFFANVIPFCNRFKIKLKPTHFSKYFYRNLGFFNSIYATKKVLYTDGLSYIIYFMRTLRFKELAKFIKYYLRGIHNKY